MMNGRQWFTVFASKISTTGNEKHVKVRRGFPQKSNPADPSVPSVYCAFLSVVYTTGSIAEIPIVPEFHDALRNYRAGLQVIPPHGIFIEKDNKHYLILENKDGEVLVSYEKNRNRSIFRLLPREIDAVDEAYQIQKYLYENQLALAGEERHRHFCSNLSTAIQLHTISMIKTEHEQGTCDCPDAFSYAPCALSDKMTIPEKLRFVKHSMKMRWIDCLDNNMQLVNGRIGSKLSWEDVNLCTSSALETDPPNIAVQTIRAILQRL